MPKTKKKSSTFDKKECPTCHKLIDIRGLATHIKFVHGKGSPEKEDAVPVVSVAPSLPQFLLGYRKGFADGYVEALERSSKS